MTIIFIGAIVAVVGGLLSAFGTFKQNKSSSSRMSSIQTKAEEIGKQSERQLKEINNLNRQNAFLQLNVDSLNNKQWPKWFLQRKVGKGHRHLFLLTGR